MLTFLRKIRRSLVESSSFRKYLLYAFGEILLVVIGILLALQINEWNQGRLNNKEEQVIEQSLYIEYTQNREVLKEKANMLSRCLTACRQVMDLIGTTEEELNQWNVDSLIYVAIEFDDFQPSTNVLSDLIQSGRLQILTNQELRDKLFEWTRTLKQKDIEYATVQKWIDDHLLSYIVLNTSLKNIDHYGAGLWDGPSKLESDNHAIFQDLEFENNMDNWVYNLLQLEDEFEELEDIMKGIIELTE